MGENSCHFIALTSYESGRGVEDYKPTIFHGDTLTVKPVYSLTFVAINSPSNGRGQPTRGRSCGELSRTYKLTQTDKR